MDVRADCPVPWQPRLCARVPRTNRISEGQGAMRELALHILDVVENAIEADAQQVDLAVTEDLVSDLLTISVRDDGRGMNAAMLAQVRDPFFTTRTTRHVGLGIPLFAAAAARCAGDLTIESTPGQGTRVTATFQHSHIDRAPLGDMPQTLMCILMRGAHLDLHYIHRVISGSCAGEHLFEFDTREIRQELGDVPLSYPDVREWLSEFIAQGEQLLKET
jgi:anti-sigma regulatory factor (Ser/Thr protein kinase)